MMIALVSPAFHSRIDVSLNNQIKCYDYHLTCYEKFKASSLHCGRYLRIISVPCLTLDTISFHQHKTVLCSRLFGLRVNKWLS